MNEYLTELLDAGLSPEQLDIARSCLAHYAVDACMCSDVREEAWKICKKLDLDEVKE